MTYFATVTIVTLIIFSLAYVYAEEPPFWPAAQPTPPSEHLGDDDYDITSHPYAPGDSKASPLPSNPPSTSAHVGDDHDTAFDGSDWLVKPKDLRVVGVVFYGRRDRSSILECYTRQNLVSNGGWLDEVIWAANTDNEEDIAWINTVAANSNGDYKVVRMDQKGYGNVYEATFTDRKTIYVKIDDDVVYIEPQAIAKAVTTLISNPDALIVSANVVNSPALGWWHYHLDTTHSFKPELIPKEAELATRGNGLWKTTDLPFWEGDSALDFKEFDTFTDFFKVEEDEDIPKHRWLPTREEFDLYSSSVAATDHEGGPHLTQWAIGAQNHYSFFTNLENGELGKYGLGKDYGKGTIWHMRSHRISINFIVMRGSDVVDHMDLVTGHPKGDDEQQLTVEMPRILKRSVLVESHAIVSHFSYGPQRYLHKTDVLERYFNYANDNICPERSLIDPFSPDYKPKSNSRPSSRLRRDRRGTKSTDSA
jgi:hypothetical protein